MSCAFGLAGLACSPASEQGPGSEGTTSGDTSSTTDGATGGDTSPWFGLGPIADVRLYLDDAAQAGLEAAPKTYVEGELHVGDRVFERVGIRLKGSFTLKTLAEKPSFKVDLNRFGVDQTVDGLEKLTLHSMYADASMVREYLGYLIFRAMGVPAPRVGYVTVQVNDEPYGIYAHIESYDDVFLARAFDDPSGNLYEGENGADVWSNLERYDQDEGEDTSRRDLMTLSEIVHRDGDSIFYANDTPLDLSRFLDFVATEALVGHFDGYWEAHNYFLYHEPASDRWTLMPWSLDQVFARELDPFGGQAGRLKAMCIRSDRCRVDYARAAMSVLERYEALDVPSRLDEVVAHIAKTGRADRRKRFDDKTVDEQRSRTRGFLAGRAASFRKALACIETGVEPDADADGFGACYEDCNDADPAIHRTAVEVCDGIDNDCSGYADDVPECPCPSEVIGGQTFYFCPYVRTWLDALAFCGAQGHQLATIDDAAQNEAVWMRAQATRPGWWAIGLNDRVTENDYRWPDGRPATYTAWADGQPAHALEWFDCAFYQSTAAPAWAELNCIESAPFICRGVAP